MTAIDEAASQLLAGQLVGLPTETVYGLAGCAHLREAVHKIYSLKKRPSHNPLIVHVEEVSHIAKVGKVSKDLLMRLTPFMPGPLTLVVPLQDGAPICRQATAGLSTVAIRIPAHPQAQALLRAVGHPLVAPSANISGTVSPTTAAHVRESFPELLVLDGGASQQGIESTILDLTEPPYRILRPGTITQEMLEETLGVSLNEKAPHIGEIGLKAPGLMKKHYAPQMPLRLDVSDPEEGEVFIAFGPDEAGRADYSLSARGDLAEAARHLFALLRAADQKGRPIAIAPIPRVGIGIAINDRLQRAAAREEE